MASKNKQSGIGCWSILIGVIVVSLGVPLLLNTIWGEDACLQDARHTFEDAIGEDVYLDDEDIEVISSKSVEPEDWELVESEREVIFETKYDGKTYRAKGIKRVYVKMPDKTMCMRVELEE
ncbi:hypothetical protein [Bacillus sp. T33-2]|uniref:hypothetical protein n=1 Tax=Bacillus sp. T33-2 TaxID=2054168 RepID=UPI000C758119|nr:hypothetical protein [Bacillus sp. T33-2]PLR99581.1 hypothetical protein CVD19_00530 [Bacillus sp. T33-2]